MSQINNNNNGSKNHNNNGKSVQKTIKQFKKPDEIDLARIFRIINRRKIILIMSVISVLGLVFLYNTFTKPIYEASVLLKKEKSERNDKRDELAEIISLQSPAEIETEMELVKTSDVLNDVIEELGLFTMVEKIEYPNGSAKILNNSLLEYNHNFQENSSLSKYYPQFLEFSQLYEKKSFYLYIKKSSDNTFQLYSAEKDSLMLVSKDESAATFDLPKMKIAMYWPSAVVGSRVYFKVSSLADTRVGLKKSVSVEQRAKTDVFEISVKAASPFASQWIANTITEKFRHARIEQQKQSIRYSFDFVDENLEDIKRKLEESENALSNYKAANQIMDVEGSSNDLIQFLSNLEAEKMSTELQLTDFQNKYSGMQGELKSKGYFDQTFLSPSPQGNEPTNSPFSTLMRQLSDLELQRLELLQKRKENHPDVVNLDNQIAQMKQQLTGYNENTLTSYQIMIGSLNKKLNKLNDLMNRYEGKMRNLPGQENKLASLVRQKNVYTKMYTLLLDKREEMRMAELSKLQDIIVVDAAHQPLEPVLPRKNFNLIAGMIFGMLIGFVGIFLVELKNKKLVSLDDIENDFHLPILAIIPNYTKELEKKIQASTTYDSRFVTLMEEQEGFKESFRVLRTKISTLFEYKKKIMMFTSCEENTGKTTIVANLAISLAQARNKVLVIDCDLKKATLSSIFEIPPDSPGLISYLKKKVAQPYIYNKAVRTLDILPSGGISESSSDLLSTERMKNLFNMINASSYDYIIIDTPPVTRVVDTLVIAKIIKDVILVLRPDHTYKDSVVWGLQELELEKANICGTVINAGDISKSSFKYRYGYGYGYGYGKAYKLEQ